MTHEQAIDQLAAICAHTPLEVIGMSSPLLYWFAIAEAETIPLIHIPEVARIIGVKPSEIDPYFIGKDDLTIDWSEK